MKSKKILKLIACFMVVVLVAACGNGAGGDVGGGGDAGDTADTVDTADTADDGDVEDSDDGGDAAGAAGEEPFRISFMTWEFYNAPTYMGQVTWSTMGEILNIYVDFEFSSNYDEAITLRLTAGDLPDIFGAPTHIFARYYGTGVVRELDDLLNTRGQNVLAAIDRAGIRNNVLADDGHFYFIPQIEESYVLQCGGWINRRWMEASGVTDVPTTTDELYAALAAFQEHMGESAIPLIRGPWYSLLHPFFRYFGTSPSWIMFDESVGVVFAPYHYQEETLMALEFLHRLYDERLLDQEFLDRDDASIRAAMVNDDVGFFISWSDGASLWCYGGADETDFVPVPPLHSPVGRTFTGIKGVIGGTFSLSGSISDESAERVMDMLNFMFGPEGESLFTWGVEGVTFEYVDGQREFTDLVWEHEVGPLNGRRTLGMNPIPIPHIASWEGWAAILAPDQETLDQVEMGLPYLIPHQPVLTGTEDEEREFASIMADISLYTENALEQFIVGVRPLDDFDNFIANLEAMGIQRAQEIRADQYQRWLNR